VAVKIIKLEPGEELDEVLNEVNFLRDCTNKNIVSYIGCFMKKGQVKGQKIIWIVMEFCGGGSVEACNKSNARFKIVDLKNQMLEIEIKCIIRECLMVKTINLGIRFSSFSTKNTSRYKMREYTND
jgi:serine/threonine protein kinase